MLPRSWQLVVATNDVAVTICHTQLPLTSLDLGQILCNQDNSCCHKFPSHCSILLSQSRYCVGTASVRSVRLFQLAEVRRKVDRRRQREVRSESVRTSSGKRGSATNARHLLHFRTRGEKGFWRKWLLYCALSPKPPLQKPMPESKGKKGGFRVGLSTSGGATKSGSTSPKRGA